MIPIKSSGDEPLESLLNRATNPSNTEEDWLSINGFCDRLNEEVEGPVIAVKLLAHKIHSPQEKEALYALTVLEKCVQNCGQRFHQEIGKFRFLNELIKVISPKYLGQYTTPAVKEKCIVMLYSWCNGLPMESKIREAYQMLKTQGIIKTDPTHADAEKILPLPPKPDLPPRDPGIFGHNDDKSKQLARLLRSRNPMDLAAANRLIKSMVKEDNDRVERLSKRLSELETVRNNTKLLSEMLEHYHKNGGASDDTDIMRELYQTLDAARPNLVRLARETDENDNDGITEILQVNDAALEVIKRCHDYHIPLARSESQNEVGDGGVAGSLPPQPSETRADLLNMDNGSPPPYSEEDLLSSDLAALGLGAGAAAPKPSSNHVAQPEQTAATATGSAGLLDSALLSDLFSAPSGASNNSVAMNALPTNHNAASIPPYQMNQQQQQLQQLRQLQQQPMHLPGASQPPPPPPQQQQQQQQPKKQQAKPTAFDDLGLLGKEWVEQERRAQPPAKPLLEKKEPATEDTTSSTPRYNPLVDLLGEKLRIDLSSLDLPISEVRPDARQVPRTVLEKAGGVRLQVHFTENRPALNVRAFVLMVTSASPQALSDIHLDVSPVSEGTRVDLKPASDTKLAAFSPFMPQVAITQIVLTESSCEMDPIDLKYRITYSSSGSTQSEEGETGNLNTS